MEKLKAVHQIQSTQDEFWLFSSTSESGFGTGDRLPLKALDDPPADIFVVDTGDDTWMRLVIPNFSDESSNVVTGSSSLK